MSWQKYVFLLLILCFSPFSSAEELDTYLRNKGLVDISTLDSTICVQLSMRHPTILWGKPFTRE